MEISPTDPRRSVRWTGSLSKMASSLRVVDHPLVAHRMGILRDRTTDQLTFARMAHEITTVLIYEAFSDLRTSTISIATPVAQDVAVERVTQETVVVPILRAGLGLVPAIQEAIPVTRVCAVGLRRNEETLVSETYLDALPSDLDATRVVICDPMVATGGSLSIAASMVAARGATDVTAVCLVASVEGVATFHDAHPTVRIVTAALDPVLNDAGYIVPGLGDAGDRLFGAPVSL